MEPGKHETSAPVKKREWSKVMTLLVVLAGFIIAQEALVLMYYCIRTSILPRQRGLRLLSVWPR
jgi:hypothetical protein